MLRQRHNFGAPHDHSPPPSARCISTSAEESHPLNSTAPLATILNDVFTFGIGGAFLKLHCLLAYGAAQETYERAFIVVRMIYPPGHLFPLRLQPQLDKPPAGSAVSGQSFGIPSWTGNKSISRNPSGVPILDSFIAHGALKAADLACVCNVFAAIINRAALASSMGTDHWITLIDPLDAPAVVIPQAEKRPQRLRN